MIRNDGELTIVRQQLDRAESALHAIKRDVLPQSEERFALMAEGYVAQISDLRAEIDAYVGVGDALEARGDVVIAVKGPTIRLGEVPVSLVTQFLDRFRLGLQQLLEHEERRGEQVRAGGRRARWVEQLCDPPLLAVSPGSVKVQLGIPSTGDLLERPDQEFYRSTFALLRSGIAWTCQEDTSELDRISGRPEIRYAVLRVVRSLVPPSGSPVEEIAFSGRLVGPRRHLVLRKEARERLDAEIRRVVTAGTFQEAVGTVREIDLDKNHFVLRERPQNLPDLTCKYDEESEEEAKRCLDRPVIVRGVLRVDRPEMKVEDIELAQGGSDNG